MIYGQSAPNSLNVQIFALTSLMIPLRLIKISWTLIH